MLSRRKLLQKSKVYVILDAQVASYNQLYNITKRVLDAGVKIVQLRDKYGCVKDILKFSRRILGLTKGRALFILNDRVDLALALGADGVHLGQNDLSLGEAQKLIGSKLLIGVSAQSLAQAKKSQLLGADYIGFGSVFKTQTKPERKAMNLKLLIRVINQIKIPVFPIGGIDLNNLSTITLMGANRVAVCRAILQSKNIGQTVSQFEGQLIKNN